MGNIEVSDTDRNPDAVLSDSRRSCAGPRHSHESAPPAAPELLPSYTSTAAELASRVAMPLFTNRLDSRNFDLYGATMRTIGLLRPDATSARWWRRGGWIEKRRQRRGSIAELGLAALNRPNWIEHIRVEGQKP